MFATIRTVPPRETEHEYLTRMDTLLGEANRRRRPSRVRALFPAR